MTIRKGAEWGTAGTAPSDIVYIASDFLLAAESNVLVHCLTGGELWRCLGEPRRVIPGQACQLVSLDAIRVTVVNEGIGQECVAASHVQIGKWLSPRRFIVVSNSGFLGKRRIAPRAHPNDDVFDVVHFQSSLTFQQKVLARKRSIHGNHLPHPFISSSQSHEETFLKLRKNECLVIDGRRIKKWDSIAVHLEPNYWQIAL